MIDDILCKETIRGSSSLSFNLHGNGLKVETLLHYCYPKALPSPILPPIQSYVLQCLACGVSCIYLNCAIRMLFIVLSHDQWILSLPCPILQQQTTDSNDPYVVSVVIPTDSMCCHHWYEKSREAVTFSTNNDMHPVIQVWTTQHCHHTAWK